MACLDDSSSVVRSAAIAVAAALNLRESIPKLLELVRDPRYRVEAIAAVAAMRDPTALSVYLEAISDRDPDVRKAGEAALFAIRDSVSDELKSSVRLGKVYRSGGDDIGTAGKRFCATDRLASHRPIPTHDTPLVHEFVPD